MFLQKLEHTQTHTKFGFLLPSPPSSPLPRLKLFAQPLSGKREEEGKFIFIFFAEEEEGGDEQELPLWITSFTISFSLFQSVQSGLIMMPMLFELVFLLLSSWEAASAGAASMYVCNVVSCKGIRRHITSEYTQQHCVCPFIVYNIFLGGGDILSTRLV